LSSISSAFIEPKKVLKDFEGLTGRLRDLMRKHGESDTKGLQKAFNASHCKRLILVEKKELAV